ncbi:translationally-controlled tumor protein [Annulohypoxylon maeteangense]|uniref:translationally-controlled tumor protein n=1 Tax=Annulohypoxylon maeteangense TaxID=1927788 RepID=UPI0020077065|nr:translationally-controlled tumor protein [Annulohypoxylon maeteangense]KAI0887202.1 translationally-controlled tumor protein [Annulohypoxylon maeteangense]
MIIFRDALTESKDELLSDSFKLKDIDGIAYEADCAMIEIDAVNVDTGANASAEEADDGLEDSAQKVNNIIHSFRLQPTSFDKSSYLSYLKGYMKRLAKHLKDTGKSDEEIKEFQTKAQGFAKKIVSNFKDYEFYTGESMDVDGMVVLLNYREDGVTPFVTIWKHGLDEMKV